MAEAGTVDVDGKRCVIHYHTGMVSSTRKQKESKGDGSTQFVGSPFAAVPSRSSRNTDQHELCIVDQQGREKAFTLVDMDIAVREGNTATVMWVVPTGAEAGPPVKVFNHDTGDSRQAEPKRLLPWFFSPKLSFIVTIAGSLLGFIVFWPIGVAMLFGPYLYLRSRALKAIRGIFTSREFKRLDSQLAQLAPVAAVAA